ncbi:ShlB/FhaC/HecB family hemolysin secretion/activation protein [Microvirga sp. W0021]|uniref:ShlB/FhaC/HecB family hemolysin secretion/activation protein n=1 Tax=Hohaiivirga grylli TaxID=3133970 RepID=A0ABV0BLJ3_9HYPH
MNRCLFLICSAALTGLLSNAAYANEPPQLRGANITLVTKKLSPPVKDYNPKACFPVREIQVNGIELLDVQQLRKKLEPLAANCLDNALANAIVTAINDEHVEKGYITTQGNLPDQDIVASGRLVVNVYTGRIDKIIYNEPQTDESLPISERWSRGWKNVSEAKGVWGTLSAASRWLDTLDDPLDDFQLFNVPGLRQWLSFEGSEGDVVHIDDVQRNADFMNRVPSNKAEAKFEAGSKPATSNVVYTNNRSDSFRIKVGYETNGAALNGTGSTVDRRMRVDIYKDNLIGLNDSWQTSLASGLSTNEATAAFSLPIRRFTLGLSGSYSESLSSLQSGVDLFTRTGIVTGSLSYNLERNKDIQSSIDTSLTWRRQDRHINDARLEDQRFSIARIGFSRTHLLEGANFYYGLGFNKGLTIWNAIRDKHDITSSEPRAQFWKLDASTGFSKGFQDIGTFRIDLSGQWTDHPLYSDDQLTLGSSSSVRGFTSIAAKVDRGFVVRSEFSFVLPVDRILGDKKEDLLLAHEILTSAQPFVFIDYGYGRDLANKTDISRSGAGFGLRYNHGRLNFDIAYAHPIFETGTKNKRSPEIYLTASMKLF